MSQPFGGAASFEEFTRRSKAESERRTQQRYQRAMTGHEHWRILQMHRSVEIGGRPYPAVLTYQNESAWVPMENGKIVQVAHQGYNYDNPEPHDTHAGRFSIRGSMGESWENHDSAESFHRRMQEISQEQLTPEQLGESRQQLQGMREHAERNPLGQ